MKLCVIGLGYIGLPTAAMFAIHGNDVVGVDIDEQVVRALGEGRIHISEPGLEELVRSAVQAGRLKVAMQPEPADAFIVAVPTPIKDGTANDEPEADLSYVVSAVRSIIPTLAPGNLVVLESTVPPRTTADVIASMLREAGFAVGDNPNVEAGEGIAIRSLCEAKSTDRVFLAHCPERVLPGRILEELVSNDRIIGGLDPEAAQLTHRLYASVVRGECFLTDATTAELVKLMENTYRDVNIALANEFALVAEHLGIDVWEAIRLANRHPRVKILRPGPGVGGHCIAVDPWFIVQAARAQTPLIRAARRVNDARPCHIADTVTLAVGHLDEPTVTCLGLAYKADVDDERESPAVRVCEELYDRGFNVRAYDPHVTMSQERPWQVADLVDAVSGSDCLVLLTDHAAFRKLSPLEIGPLMRHRMLVDTRQGLLAEHWQAAGFAIVGRDLSRADSADRAAARRTEMYAISRDW